MQDISHLVTDGVGKKYPMLTFERLLHNRLLHGFMYLHLNLLVVDSQRLNTDLDGPLLLKVLHFSTVAVF